MNEMDGNGSAVRARMRELEEQLSGLSEIQLKIIAALDGDSVHVDDIIEKTGLPSQQVLSELTMLQIGGYVTQEKGKRFSLNIKA